MLNLHTLIENAIIELKDRIQNKSAGEEISDIIHETADTNVPIYTGDIIRVASDNIALLTEAPELGPAFDGSNTPVNLIAANIYEYLCEKLREVVNEMEDIEAE